MITLTHIIWKNNDIILIDISCSLLKFIVYLLTSVDVAVPISFQYFISNI